MKIAILEAPGRFEVREAPVPEPGADEVLVRVAACGVCTSELDVWEGVAGTGGFPKHLGHEVSGTVERVGQDVTSFRLGEPVALWTGRGYAEHVTVKDRHCLPAGDVPLELALAEPLACAVNSVELAAPSLGDDVLIIGAGFMGSLVQKLVLLRGPRHVVVADTRADALSRARAMGATRTVNVLEEDLPEVVRSLTDGAGVDVSFEVTGKQAPLLALGDCTRMSGKVVIVGYHQGGMREIPLGRWNWMAFQVVNAHFREEATIMRGMRTGMRLLTSGRLSLDGLVTHRFRLEDINEAFETAHRKPEGFVKSTVWMDSTSL
ncbi:MAG: zinc-binding dehydrogenase [Chloroflexota bacterium]|nr:zinc-binding dehydrogenase [Chloroflexota bacterium]